LDIHPTAIVHPQARIGPGVQVGAYSLVGENVEIGKDTILESHVIVEGWTQIGERCHLFPFVSVGAAPQAVRYRGEPTRLTVGHENVIREFVTINRGTVEGGGETKVGNGNLIMANSSTLAGHIYVEDFAIVGGLVAIHQFVRVGCYAIIGGASAVPQDVPPYMVAAGNRARLFGLNNIGLKRHNFSESTMAVLKQAYRILFRSHLTLHKALDRVEKEVPEFPEIRHLIDFLKKTKRGVCR